MKNLIKRQKKLKKKLILEDKFENINTIGGVINISLKYGILSGIVISSFPEFGILEKSYSIFKTDFPYIPGLLVFREGPSILLSFSKIKTKPDILFLKSSGICHPRFFGMASHIGVLLDIPTIGITERLLCGEVKGEKIFYKNQHVGWKLKNIYISPGHRVSLTTSLKIIKECMKNHKLPEPLYLAYKYIKKNSTISNFQATNRYFSI